MDRGAETVAFVTRLTGQLKKIGRPLSVVLGVGTFAAAWNVTSRVFQVGTVEFVFTEPASTRTYRVFTRADHDAAKPAPVLFALHAYATAPDVLVRSYSLEALAVRGRGFILVVPEGNRDAVGHYFWNASRACCGEGQARPEDLRYLQDVLGEVKRRYAVDAAQVLALGVSNGGFMAHRWACSAGAELTAIASICGAGPGPEDLPCAPSERVSVLQIHGDADEIVRYGGGYMRGSEYPSALSTLTPFLRAGHAPQASETRTSHTFLFGKIHKQEWLNGPARIALWTVEGANHKLRAAQASVPEILDFLQGR